MRTPKTTWVVILFIVALLGRTHAMSLISMLKYLNSPSEEPMIEECGEYGSAPNVENEKIPLEEVPPFKDGFESFPEWIKNIAMPAIEGLMAGYEEPLQSKTCAEWCKCFNDNGKAMIETTDKRSGGFWGVWQTCSQCTCTSQPTYEDIKMCLKK